MLLMTIKVGSGGCGRSFINAECCFTLLLVGRIINFPLGSPLSIAIVTLEKDWSFSQISQHTSFFLSFCSLGARGGWDLNRIKSYWVGWDHGESLGSIIIIKMKWWESSQEPQSHPIPIPSAFGLVLLNPDPDPGESRESGDEIF